MAQCGFINSIWHLCCGLLLGSQMVSATITCGDIGTRPNTESEANVQLFVLNTLSAATCDGSIHEYQYCFYPLSNESTTQVNFTFGLFRYNTNSSAYVKTTVSHVVMVSEVIHVDFEVEQMCIVTAFDEPIQVYSGDILGACVNTTQARVIGNDLVLNTPNYLLATDMDVCNGSIPLTINEQELTNMSGLTLHLYAEIRQSGLSTGVIVAIAIPLSAAVLLVILIICVCWCRRVSIVRASSGTEPLLPPNPGFDNVGYSAFAQNGGYSSRVLTSGTYERIENIKPQESVLIVDTPAVTSDSEEYEDQRIDSGSYAEVFNSDAHPTLMRLQHLNAVEVVPVDRHVYEIVSSDYHDQNFECSYEDVSHHEPSESPGDASPDPVGGKNPVTIKRLLEMNKEEDIYSEVRPFQRPASKERELLAQLKAWGIDTLPRDEMNLQSDIGTGQFGTVKLGVWTNNEGRRSHVALKSLKQDCLPEDKLKFLQEAAIMAQFRHPNITMLYGVVVESQPMMLVVELAVNGDLRNHLISIRPEPDERPPERLKKIFLEFSQQVALGMQYLSAKGFVHRDLAARNVLLSKKNVCKVSDFGMSRNLADESYYVSHGGLIPVKWTAPEAIHYKKFSSASDVWSYGCLLYEIWSVGHKPWEALTNIQALQTVEAGQRLFPPPGCPKKIYELMILCWHPDKSQRPGFRDISLALTEDKVLSIPEEDSSTNPLAGVLGAPLEAGENMYSQLQRRYIY